MAPRFRNAAPQTRCLYLFFFFFFFRVRRPFVHTLPRRPVNNSRRRIDYHRPVGDGGGDCVSSLRKSSRRRFLSPLRVLGAVMRATFSALPFPLASMFIHARKREMVTPVGVFLGRDSSGIRSRTDTCNFFYPKNRNRETFVSITGDADGPFNKYNKIDHSRLTIE